MTDYTTRYRAVRDSIADKTAQLVANPVDHNGRIRQPIEDAGEAPAVSLGTRESVPTPPTSESKADALLELRANMNRSA